MNGINSPITPSYTTVNSNNAVPELNAANENASALASDSVELSSEDSKAANAATKKKKGIVSKTKAKAKAFSTKVNDTVEQAKYAPIKFIKAHKGPVAAGAAAAIAAGVVIIARDPENNIDTTKSVVTALASGGTKNKIVAYSGIAELLGTAAAVGVTIGAAAHVAIGVSKVVKGITNIGKGVVAKDKIKVSRGIRTTVAGVRKALTGAVIGTLNADIKGVGKIATFTRKFLQPPLRKAAAVLNVGVGVQVLVDGIKNKDRSKILTGALDLSYGIAVGACIVGGGAPATIAANVLLATKEVVSHVRGYKKFKAKEAQKDQPNAPANKEKDATVAPATKENSGSKQSSPVQQATKTLKNSNDTQQLTEQK